MKENCIQYGYCSLPVECCNDDCPNYDPICPLCEAPLDDNGNCTDAFRTGCMFKEAEK